MKDILERLRGYNPVDRTITDQRQIAVDINDAATEIERLRGALKVVIGLSHCTTEQTGCNLAAAESVALVVLSANAPRQPEPVGDRLNADVGKSGGTP